MIHNEFRACRPLATSPTRHQSLPRHHSAQLPSKHYQPKITQLLIRLCLQFIPASKLRDRRVTFASTTSVSILKAILLTPTAGCLWSATPSPPLCLQVFPLDRQLPSPISPLQPRGYYCDVNAAPLASKIVMVGRRPEKPYTIQAPLIPRNSCRPSPGSPRPRPVLVVTVYLDRPTPGILRFAHSEICPLGSTFPGHLVSQPPSFSSDSIGARWTKIKNHWCPVKTTWLCVSLRHLTYSLNQMACQ